MLAWHWLAEYNREWKPYRGLRRQPNGEQWFGGACLGLLAGTVWPLVLAASLSRGVLFAPPRDVQLAREQERVRELERELGIGGHDD